MIHFFKSLFSKKSVKIEESIEPMGPIHHSEGKEYQIEDETSEAPTVDNENTSHHNRVWIGVDLDGTLAQYSNWKGLNHIGRPIPAIKARIEEWMLQGYQVKIFTARASVKGGIEPVKEWLKEHGFPDLEVTNQKDFHMLELWDDRAVQVVPNTGSPVISARYGALPRAPLFGIEYKEKDFIKEQREENSSDTKS